MKDEEEEESIDLVILGLPWRRIENGICLKISFRAQTGRFCILGLARFYVVLCSEIKRRRFGLEVCYSHGLKLVNYSLFSSHLLYLQVVSAYIHSISTKLRTSQNSNNPNLNHIARRWDLKTGRKKWDYSKASLLNKSHQRENIQQNNYHLSISTFNLT